MRPRLVSLCFLLLALLAGKHAAARFEPGWFDRGSLLSVHGASASDIIPSGRALVGRSFVLDPAFNRYVGMPVPYDTRYILHFLESEVRVVHGRSTQSYAVTYHDLWFSLESRQGDRIAQAMDMTGQEGLIFSRPDENNDALILYRQIERSGDDWLFADLGYALELNQEDADRLAVHLREDYEKHIQTLRQWISDNPNSPAPWIDVPVSRGGTILGHIYAGDLKAARLEPPKVENPEDIILSLDYANIVRNWFIGYHNGFSRFSGMGPEPWSVVESQWVTKNEFGLVVDKEPSKKVSVRTKYADAYITMKPTGLNLLATIIRRRAEHGTEGMAGFIVQTMLMTDQPIEEMLDGFGMLNQASIAHFDQNILKAVRGQRLTESDRDWVARRSIDLSMPWGTGAEATEAVTLDKYGIQWVPPSDWAEKRSTHGRSSIAEYTFGVPARGDVVVRWDLRGEEFSLLKQVNWFRNRHDLPPLHDLEDAENLDRFDIDGVRYAIWRLDSDELERAFTSDINAVVEDGSRRIIVYGLGMREAQDQANMDAFIRSIRFQEKDQAELDRISAEKKTGIEESRGERRRGGARGRGRGDSGDGGARRRGGR